MNHTWSALQRAFHCLIIGMGSSFAVLWYPVAAIYHVLFVQPVSLCNMGGIGCFVCVVCMVVVYTDTSYNRFKGYGHDKASYLMELDMAGYGFWVLPDVWIVHINHGTPQWKEQQTAIEVLIITFLLSYACREGFL